MQNFDGCERPLAVIRTRGGTHLPPCPEVRPCNSYHFPLIFPLGFNAPTFIYILHHLCGLYSSSEGAPWQLTLQAGLFKIRLVGSSPKLCDLVKSPSDCPWPISQRHPATFAELILPNSHPPLPWHSPCHRPRWCLSRCQVRHSPGSGLPAFSIDLPALTVTPFFRLETEQEAPEVSTLRSASTVASSRGCWTIVSVWQKALECLVWGKSSSISRYLRLKSNTTARAPGEAEAYCAWLDNAGLVDAVVSDDSDCFCYGAKTVLRNFSTDPKNFSVTRCTARRLREEVLLSGLLS